MAIKEVLLAVEEGEVQELLHIRLLKHNFNIRCAGDGKDALAMIQAKVPDLLLINLDLSRINGIEVCKWLRHLKETRHVPVMILEINLNEDRVIEALNAGADDSISWPVSSKFLAAKINSLGRRAHSKSDSVNDVIEVDGIKLFPNKRILQIGSKPIETTFSEFQILYLLINRPGWVFTREQIVEGIRGKNYCITDRAIDVQIVGLRKKMGHLGHLIETVRGVGYRFKEI